MQAQYENRTTTWLLLIALAVFAESSIVSNIALFASYMIFFAFVFPSGLKPEYREPWLKGFGVVDAADIKRVRMSR